MKIIPYLLYLLLLGMHVAFGREITALYGYSINLAALVILLVSYYKSEITCAWFGFLAGLVVAAGQPGIMGWSGLIFASIGVSAYHLQTKMNLESMYAKLLMILGGVLTANLLLLFLVGTDSFFVRIITVSLPEAIYTTLFGWLFILVKEGHLTFTKIKSIF